MPFICPLMSTPDKTVYCTTSCALCVDHAGVAACAIDHAVYRLDEIKALLTPKASQKP